MWLKRDALNFIVGLDFTLQIRVDFVVDLLLISYIWALLLRKFSYFFSGHWFSLLNSAHIPHAKCVVGTKQHPSFKRCPLLGGYGPSSARRFSDLGLNYGMTMTIKVRSHLLYKRLQANFASLIVSAVAIQVTKIMSKYMIFLSVLFVLY